ncbi:hypothetical protein pipiens_001328 [Culex pipiens pipiens]|uniref:GPI ethanolamine phosphate transferase 3 n=1 Tax=Culex pipiens pipiens TaxID=38569 RepID=A0ABD1D2C0_CULPP
MAKSWNFVFVLVWLSAILGAGIHLFSKGFLLTRIAQTDFSSCVRYEDIRCGTGGGDNDGDGGSCKVESILRDVNQSAGICMPRKGKVILLVIDALRYDFGEFDASLKDPLPYQNGLPVLEELRNRFPDRTRRLKFVADPPTTTLQRLKAMTTGSLPTFIDIGSNFASPEINEDNVVDQWKRHNLSTIFLGDSTWTELFPGRFKRKYDYPSFNIHDLDTVDSAIERHLPKEIGKSDWDVIVAHFLGVDHCGHRYGPLHGEMQRKLKEMNDVIRNVTEQMDDETTLVIIGDHGMTQTGDHGGESSDEVNALFFMYSKGTPLLSEEYDEYNKTIQQIDLHHLDALAWVVYGLLLLQIAVLAFSPLLIYVLPKRKEVMSVLQSDRNVAPEIFRQLRSNFNSRNPSAAADEIPVVCGLATAYSSVFIGVGIFLTILMSLLLGSHGTTGLILSLVITICYGIISSILQYENSTNLLSCLQPTMTTLLSWIILMQFGFYATAHQPTMSQIDWNAAFVGRTWHYDNNNVISAILVLLNTFSVTFVLSTLFPLIIFTPFCVYTMWPSLAQKIYQKSGGGGKPKAPKSSRKTDAGNVEYRSVTVNKPDDEEAGDEESTSGGRKAIDFDVTKGEINLYENEKLFVGTVFKTGCQLLLIQGVRIFCAMFACTMHCRHLMVWKIFAPRFIYEGIGSYIAFIGLNLGFLLLLRVHAAVNALITRINKAR